ncbi:MAG: DMT family transporter [Bryobacteraceae bacterium]|nr:DMT family transporter [Bryobacteraceae bacterium]
MTRQTQGELALIGVTLVWGATFVIVKNALDQVSTLLFLAMRFSLAALVLALLFRGRLRAARDLRGTTLAGGALAGGCLFFAYFFQTYGLRFTTPSKSAFITGLTTALVPFLSALVYKRAPHLAEGVGVGIATVGLAMLTLPPGRFTMSAGDALTLCCTVTFAFHILILGRWAPRSSFELLSVSQIGMTALLALAVCGWAEPMYLEWSPRVGVAVLVTGLLATALAFTVQAWAQRYTTPVRAALIFALEPVSAAITSYGVEGELLRGRALAGAAMIMAGVLLVELKPGAWRKHPFN